MSAELLDVDRHRRGQTLGPETIEAQGPPVGTGQRREAVLLAGLVAGDQWRAVLDGGVRSGEMGDARLGVHAPSNTTGGGKCHLSVARRYGSGEGRSMSAPTPTP